MGKWFAPRLTWSFCLNSTWPKPLGADEHPASQGHKGLTIPVIVWEAIHTHHFVWKRSGAHQARTSKINTAFMDRKRLCTAVPLLFPLSSSIAGFPLYFGNRSFWGGAADFFFFLPHALNAHAHVWSISGETPVTSGGQTHHKDQWPTTKDDIYCMFFPH